MIVRRQKVFVLCLFLFLVLALVLLPTSSFFAGKSQPGQGKGEDTAARTMAGTRELAFLLPGGQAGRLVHHRQGSSPPHPPNPYADTIGENTIATALNITAIVFREGLEAVLILASLMGSLKRGEARKFRSPLWIGATLSLVATALTWMLAAVILGALAGFGERLEAVVSLIAIGVLLLITNWFFHKVYWTGWVAGFHSKKGKLLSAAIGQWIGLVMLGFSSVYREGFEIVLFSQALVLQAGTVAVAVGVGLGLLGTLVVGIIVFGMQVKLPYRKMLIVTGVLIGWVLIILVGNTVDVLQRVGWLPVHAIGTLHTSPWLILTLGLFPTWEGVLSQLAAGTFVIGSYVLAEHQQRKKQRGSSPKARRVSWLGLPL